MVNGRRSRLTVSRKITRYRWQSLAQLVSVVMAHQPDAKTLRASSDTEKVAEIPRIGASRVVEVHRGDRGLRRGTLQRVGKAHTETTFDEVRIAPYTFRSIEQVLMSTLKQGMGESGDESERFAHVVSFVS